MTLDSLYDTDEYTQLVILSIIIIITFYYLFLSGRSSEKQETDLARSVAIPIPSEQSTPRNVSEFSPDISAVGAVSSMATVLLESTDDDEEDKQVPDNLSDISGSSVDTDTTAVGTLEQVLKKEHKEFGTTVFEEKAIAVERSLGSENEEAMSTLTEHVETAVKDFGKNNDTPSLAEMDLIEQEAECTLLEIDDASRMIEPTTKIEDGTQQTVSQSVTENLQDAETDQLYVKKRSTNDVCNTATNDTDEIVEQRESSPAVDTITTTEQVIETTINEDNTVSITETITEEITVATQNEKDDELTTESVTETIRTETPSEPSAVVEESTSESVSETTTTLDEETTTQSASEPAAVVEESASITTSAVTANSLDTCKVNDPSLQDEIEEPVQPLGGVESIVEADLESRSETVEPLEPVKVLDEKMADEQVDEPAEDETEAIKPVETKVETMEHVTELEDASIEKETVELDDSVETVLQDDHSDTNNMSSTDSESKIDPVEPSEPVMFVNDTTLEKEAKEAVVEPMDREISLETVELNGPIDTVEDISMDNKAHQHDDMSGTNQQIDEPVTLADTAESHGKSIEKNPSQQDDTLEMDHQVDETVALKGNNESPDTSIETKDTTSKEQGAETNTYPVMMIPFTRANPLNKPKQEMSRIERIEQQRQPYIPLYKSRCAFWPGCTNNHCKYYHPFIECRNGKACQYGKKCVFLHPKDYSAQPKGTKTKGKNKTNQPIMVKTDEAL